MSFNLVIEPRALVDIQTAIDYYDSKQIGLGKKFSVAVNDGIESVSKNPFFNLRYKDYRGLPIKKFPYIIFFYINENKKTVFGVGVFNTHQNPEKYPQ